MTYFTGLARVARKTGYPVVEVSGWKTRGYGGMSKVHTVVCHHTAGPRSGNYPSLNVVTHGRPGLAGPLAHYGIGRDGKIYVIAAGRANHAGKVRKAAYANSHAIGIEAENTGTGEPWSNAQMDSYVKLCRALRDEFKIKTSAILGHKEVCSPKGRKIDPYGFSMGTFRKAVARGYWKKPASKPSVKPAGKPKPKPSGKSYPAVALPKTRKHTKASHAAWVLLMKEIGHNDKKLGLALQKWLRGLGYYTRAYRLDGLFRKASVKALQRFLKAKGLYPGKVDGKRKTMTVGAEIDYLNSQRKYL